MIKIYVKYLIFVFTFVLSKLLIVSCKKIHIISIGGSAMHNIALDLVAQGNIVTGSDDEIYEPSLSRLKNAGVAPDKLGWYPEKITNELDFIILGMHARIDNPELLKAQEMGIKIYSYPEFVYQQSIHKQRVVIAGSHGKTTTTAMVMHVLRKSKRDFDYLVGAQLEGFDRMVKLTDAPLIIIEGDEYLSSPIDPKPKILHYKPHITVITGIAWDHINVFHTFEIYVDQFRLYCDTIDHKGTLIYFEADQNLKAIAPNVCVKKKLPYSALPINDNRQIQWYGQSYPIKTIGNHNLQNMNAARLICNELGIDDHTFLNSIADFSGANKRLQKIAEKDGRHVFLDFAHAPSKVMATTQSFKEWFNNKPLLAVLELHTFSSLNTDFLQQYRGSLNSADQAIVYYNTHTLKMKKMPPLDEDFVKVCFNHPSLQVFTDELSLHEYLKAQNDWNLLLMTSGNFNKMPLDF